MKILGVDIGETEMEKKILFQIREDWLALRQEEPIDPAMPIIDPHHHLWDRGLRETASAAVIGRSRQDLAALCRDMPRSAGPKAGDVRKQFSRRQALLQLWRDVERLQAAGRAVERRRKGGPVLQHRPRHVSAADKRVTGCGV